MTNDQLFSAICIMVLLGSCGGTQTVPEQRSQAVQPHFSPSSVTRPAAGTYHTVKSGEGLSYIAKRYGMRMEDIAALNDIKPPNYVIHPGQKLLLAAPLSKAEETLPLNRKQAVDRGATSSVREVVYPPVRDPSIRRISLSVRGSCPTASAADSGFAFYALAPRNLGYTLNAQPALYWWISKPASTAFMFTVTRAPDNKLADAADPLLQIPVQLSADAGIHALSLVDYNVTLERDVEYEWFLALKCGTDRSLPHIVSGGAIKHIAPPAGLASRLAQAEPQQLLPIYAESGFFYDVLHTSSEQIRREPGNHTPRKVRTELLEQAGLPEAAAYQ
ncbi:MAG: DUF928 domain-containing protein [Gammaproteobacteria bacterium]|nr:DUF928 domain-containing protein [Gammaproteobacteria bacterium]